MSPFVIIKEYFYKPCHNDDLPLTLAGLQRRSCPFISSNLGYARVFERVGRVLRVLKNRSVEKRRS
jgi:hypothetical protein